jgi:uncharacterized protein with FMN-binding domain
VVNRARPMAGRRNAALAAATGVVAGLLFLYPTSLNHSTGSAAGAAVTGPASVSGSASTANASGTGAAVEPVGSTNGTQTITGGTANTRYGPVQVQITVAGGRITSANAIRYPTESGRDRQINSFAVPELDAAVLSAQSAGIDTVSGATYTSDGYRQSLQSALDAAHLA